MRHDSTWLYCDSAYLNEKENNVIAYGHVHIKVSDTLNIFGDTLKYDGNTDGRTDEKQCQADRQ